MISLRKSIHLLISFGLMLFISTASGFIAHDASATPLFTVTVGHPWSQASGPLAWGFGNAEAKAKNLEGKAQEFMGDVKGDPKDQLMGKSKQVQSRAQRALNNAKDSRAGAVAKNLEGKLQEMNGNITNNPGDQMMGKAKQVEGQVRNTVEDVKSAAQNLIN